MDLFKLQDKELDKELDKDDNKLDNINNRCLHHYVYDDKLLMDICKYFACEFIY